MPVVYFFLVMISCLGAPVSRAADPFPADNDFIRKAERAGNQEIADARAALATSKDPAVRNLAQQMEGDGTAVNQRLATLAVEKGWPAPSLDPPDAIGPYSDHRYVARQIRAERHALAFYAEEAANGADTGLQEFARNTVSVFRQRLAALRLLVST